MSDSKRAAVAPDANSTRPHRDVGAVLASAGVFAVGTMLSRILGLIRDILIARYFSVNVRDAFVNAFRLPNVFRRIFGEGALSASFIPVFLSVIVGERASGQTQMGERSRTLLAGVFSLLLALVSTLSILAVLFMPTLLHLLLAGRAYVSVPGKFELTVRLARIMFSFLIVITLFSYFMAILNALRKFALTALAPCLFNLVIIGVALTSSGIDASPTRMAWAVLVGGFSQMSLVAVGVWRSGFLPRFTLRWWGADTLRVLRATFPSVLGISVLQLSTLVTMRFASQLAPGSHAYLYLADRIFELPLSLFVVSVGAALLPTLAHKWAEGDRMSMGHTLNHSFRVILFLTVPAALGMALLAQPIAQVLFAGREFGPDDVVKTANLIQVYSFGLIIAAGVRILTQGFYAVGNVWFPAISAVSALISQVLFAYLLMQRFALPGLAGASVLSALVHLLLLTFVYHARVAPLEIRSLAASLARFALASVTMAGALQMYPWLQSSWEVPRAVLLVVMIGTGALVYVSAAVAFRAPEAQVLLGEVRLKLARRRDV